MIGVLLLACATDGEPDPAAVSDVAVPVLATGPTEDTGLRPTTPTTPCAPAPGARLLRRLSHAEYGAAVRWLLHTDARPEDAFVPDLQVDGWDGDAGLGVSTLLGEQYRAAAEDLAADAELDRILPCPGADRACADTFIGAFGRRAYRRPLTAAERTALLFLWDEVAADDGFEEGIRWVVTAMLQSPGFLYRSELGARTAGEVFTLDDWELATALAFGVTGAPPDDALLDRAAAGALTAPGGVEAELARLRTDPRAADRVTDAVVAQLQLARLPQVVRDPVTYPDLTPAIRDAMTEETRRLVQDVGPNGTWAGLLRADHTWLTAELAAFYGLPSPGVGADGWGRAALPPTRAGGILAQGAVLTTHALPTSSSPVHRGVLVRERLLCHPLPMPPPDLDTSPPPVDPSLSTRERFAAHAEQPECAGCHALIDPLGFGFEHFDGVGRYRTEDGVHPVDASGELGGVPFDGLGELAALLEAPAAACWTERGARWLTGLDLPTCDREVFDDASGPTLGGVWDGWAALPHFRERVGGSGERDAPRADGAWSPPDPLPDLDTGDTGYE